jgi:hypothetical protein
MKVRMTLLLGLLVISASAQAQMLRVNVSSSSIDKCRRGQSKRYDINVGGQFEVENTSEGALLLPKIVDVVRVVTVSLSLADAKHQKYSFVMDQEFGASRKSVKPRINDFIAISHGEKRMIEITSVSIPATADFNENDRSQLRPGKYWMQFEFLPLPNSFPSGDKEFHLWQEKWKSSGTLLRNYVLTEPFLVEVAFDLNVPKCS